MNLTIEQMREIVAGIRYDLCLTKGRNEYLAEIAA